MKNIALSALLAAPLFAGCLSGGYAPPGSFSYREPFPPMQPGAEAHPVAGAQQPGAGVEATPGDPLAGPVTSGDPSRPLVGWDGGVVASPQGGSITPADPTHGIGPSEKGRMHILELYQGVIDERDALADEVQALRGELSHRELVVQQTDRQVGELEARIATLEQERLAQAKEIEDLLGRLTTAQIRRLEAEKLVLETKLAEHADAVEAQAAAAVEGR